MSKSVITVNGSDLTIILERLAALYPSIRTLKVTVDSESGDPRGYLRVQANGGPEYVAVGRVGTTDPVTALQELANDYANGSYVDTDTDTILRRVMELLPQAYDKLVTG